MTSTSRLQYFAAAAISAFVVAGCASLNVGSFADGRVEFSRYRTYGWGPVDNRPTGDPRLDNNPFFEKQVKTAVEKQLSARRFEKIASGTPDLLLHYHASIRQRIDVNGADRKYGYCDRCEPFVFDAGTLTLDIVDTRSNRLVWRGWAEGSIDGVVDNQGWMEQRINEAVTRIMKRLPRGL